MVQAYLGKPNYTNAMNAGLRTRLAYDESRRRRMGGGGGGGGGMSERIAQRAPAGSPEARALYRNQMLQEQGKEAEVSQAEATVAGTEADTLATQALTAGREKQTDLMGQVTPEATKKAQLDNEMAEANLKKEHIAQQKTIMDNMLQYLPVTTQENYRDLIDWGVNSGLDASAFDPAEKIEAMTPVEWKVHQSNMEKMLDPGPKKLKAQADAKLKEDKAAAAEKKLLEDARDDYAKYMGLADKLTRTGGLSAFEMAFLSEADKKKWGDQSPEEQVALLEKRAALIKADHPNLNMGPIPATEPGGWHSWD